MRNTDIDAENELDNAPPQFNPMQVLLRHKLLLFLCGVTGCAIGYLYYVREPRVYESSATLLVVQEKASNLPIKSLESSRTLDDNLLTQMILIRSPLVVDKAAADPRIAKLHSIAGAGNPAGTILAGLSVSQARGANQSLATDVLSLSFQGADPDDCAAVVETVISAYQAFLGETRQSISNETVELITRARDSLLKDLTQKEAAFREFRQKSPLLWSGDEGRNIHHERLADVETARSKMLITRAELKAQIQAIERAISEGGNREALVLMTSQLAAMRNREMGSTSSGSTFEEQRIALAIEEETLLERLGPNHPKVLALRKQIEVTRRLSTALTPAAKQNQESSAAPDLLEAYIGSLRQQLAVLDSEETELNSLFATEKEGAREIGESEIENATLQADIARTQQLFDGVVKRLDEISLIKDVGGTYTQIISKPRRGIQVKPRLATTLASALLIGLAVGFALGAALELSNREFRSLDEVTKQLGVAIVGQFPQFTTSKPPLSGSVVEPTVFAYHQPKSPVSEAYRAIRTYIYFSTHESGQAGRAVLQVTSPLPGDGKTTLTASLAVTMAQSGKRILFIEADLRRPRAAKLFGLTSDAGLVSAIIGDQELDDCIFPTEVENLWLMPVGVRPPNPSELLCSPRFRELLNVVREKFDFVVIDSPPLLPVTDASVIASACDGVVLLLRVRKDMRSAALAAVAKLRAVGANVLGTVVRGQFEGSRGAGGYGYGNGYGYGYGYGYEYAEPYDDDDAETHSVANGNGSRVGPIVASR